MATDNTEVDSFQDFLSRRQNGRDFGSLAEAVGEFRRYQQELADARNKVQVGIEQSNRGESRPLDIDEVVSDVRDRLASDGITD